MKELTGTKKDIVLEIKENPGVRQSELADKLNISKAAVNQHISDLNDYGAVERREITDNVEVSRRFDELGSELKLFLAGYLLAGMWMFVYPDSAPYIFGGLVFGSFFPLFKKVQETFTEDDFLRVKVKEG